MGDLPTGFPPPGDEPDDRSSAGTPGFGFLPGGTGDLGQALQQLGKLLSEGKGGPVSWTAAGDAARQALLAAGDASSTSSERRDVDAAVRLAEHWLDDVTALPAAVTTTDAWSRSDWLNETLPRWQPLIEPIAERMAAASLEAVPEEMRSMAGPMLAMAQQMASALFGMQAGQGLAALGASVVSSSDVGIPLAAPGVAALLPLNVAAFGEGLELPDSDVRLFLALREAAHVRLFHAAPWLRARLISLVTDYAAGITIDVSSMEQVIGSLDVNDPASVHEALGSGLFEPPTTPRQQAALERLEATLALIEGWVDVVVDAAARDRLPSASALRETLRRRRATGGPAEATFANLVGLTLRPRRLRDAATLWQTMSDEHGVDVRDVIWQHPDLVPGPDDLDDVAGYIARSAQSSTTFDLSSLEQAGPAPAQESPQAASDDEPPTA